MNDVTQIALGIQRIQFETFDQWLDARHGIGGSDASAVIGKNPYKTNQELWMEKTGRAVAPDISDIERNEVEEDIEYIKKQEETFWQQVETDRKPPLILPEI